MSATPPDHPAGPFEKPGNYNANAANDLIESVRQAPVKLRDAVHGLTDAQLDTKYKNWTIRQIVGHLADSHAHIYIRFKWTLTEENPTIKAYEEGDWVALADSTTGDITPALSLFDGLHAKWAQLLKTMTEKDFARTFFHPQSGETVDLWTTLNYYPWHARHHTGQICWLVERMRG